MKIFVGLCLIGVALAAEWSYDSHGNTKGPSRWAEDYADCAKSRQSPIDIKDPMYNSALENFVLTGYNNMSAVGGGLTIINNGHTAQVNVANVGGTKMSGGGLDGEYIAVQVHYHWGRNDMEGSEHYFQGGQYPLEAHIVHYKASYQNLTTAVTKSDGLAVLGFFFVIDHVSNPKLTPLIEGLGQVAYKDDSASVPMHFVDTMPDLSTQEYYRYMGSLTTPTCAEAVVWTVFENKIHISSTQLAKFRALQQKDSSFSSNIAIDYNFRPLQPLAGRSVYKNYEGVPSTFHWEYEGYQGVDAWPKYYPTCSGKQQSPINIPEITSPSIAKYDASMGLDTLEFLNYDLTVRGKIKNNGHTIQLDVDNSNMYIHKGGLDSRFKVVQLHFHWGRDNAHGSEHTHAGKMYPLEMHIVHYNTSYPDFATAAGKFDGLAVVGFWFEVGELNTNYATLISSLPDVRFKGLSKSISGFSLRDLTYSDLKTSPNEGSPSNYYRYDGGLTTPGCNQHVTWSVMTRTIKMSSSQIAAFRDMLHITETNRALTESDKIGLNYRPTQRLYSRVIHTSWDHDGGMRTAAAPRPVNSLVALAALVLFAVLLR